MKVAITGTIGSGKTSVSEYLRNKGFEVFDCDKYNDELLKREDIIKKISLYFKDAVCDNKIDKKALASIVFDDLNKRKILENILHPLIIEEMKNRMSLNKLFFAEVPLLFEKDLDKLFDISIVIICSNDITIKRLSDRGMSINDINNRINSQLDNNIKIQRGTEIIYNNGSFPFLYREIDKLIAKYGWE